MENNDKIKSVYTNDLTHRWRLLAEAEHSGVAQTDGGNGGFGAQGGFVVTVPADAVMAVTIKVTQQWVEAASAHLLQCLAKC